jgi:hypothetical protein
MDPQRREIERIEHVTLPPHHKPWRNACVFAAEQWHGILPDERCHDPGWHPREIVRLKHDHEGPHRAP